MKRFVRHMRWWLAALAVAAVGAGCGSSSNSSSTSASASSGGTSSTSSSTASTHSFKGTISVGVVGDNTGDLSVAANVQGALAYFDEVNAGGGVDGYKIAVQQYDTQSNPSDAVQTFNRAIAAKPNAILSASFVATGGLPTLANSGIPSVGDGFSPGWTGHPTLFSPGGDDTAHLSNVYLVVAKKYGGSDKVALIGSAIDAPSQANIERQAAGTGVQFVYKNVGLSLTPTAAQFLSTAEQIKSSGAGTVVSLGVEGLSQLQTDLNQIGAKTKAIATDTTPPSTSQNGLLVSLPWASSYVTGNPGITQYIADMKKSGYGSMVATAAYAPYRWAQAALLVHALTVAGPPFSRVGILKALSGVTNFTAGGVIPPTSFPKFQKVGGSCQAVLEVVNGHYKPLINGPSPFICGGPSLPDGTS